MSSKIYYKYRKFDQNLIGSLYNDTIYYADPTSFNDPMDVNPIIDIDVDECILGKIINALEKKCFVQGSIGSGVHATLHQIGAIDYLYNFSESVGSDAERRFSVQSPSRRLNYAEKEIKKLLLNCLKMGLFCVSENSNSVLMWSHYGDNHHGVAVGYSVPDKFERDLFDVKYGMSRIVKASDILKMIEGDEDAKNSIKEIIFLAKSSEWGYEKEKRFFGNFGSNKSFLELSEILFGLKCPIHIMYSIVSMMDLRLKKPSYYKMVEIKDPGCHYDLEKISLDPDWLSDNRPKRFLDVIEASQKESS